MWVSAQQIIPAKFDGTFSQRVSHVGKGKRVGAFITWARQLIPLARDLRLRLHSDRLSCLILRNLHLSYMLHETLFKRMPAWLLFLVHEIHRQNQIT